MKGRTVVGGLLALALGVAWAWFALGVGEQTVRGPGEHGSVTEPRASGAGETRTEVSDLSLDERITALEGEDEQDAEDRIARVVSETGEPLANATVHFEERAFVTDSDGRVEFEWPEDDRVLEFDVRHPAHVDVVEERADSGREQLFRLRRGHTIRGWVRFPDGAPVPEVLVSAWSDEGTNRPKCHTNERGEFVLTGVPDWKVFVQAENARTKERAPQIIGWTAGDAIPEFTVRQSFVLLRIHSSDGKPLDSLRVRAGDLITTWGRNLRDEAVGVRNTYRRFHSPEHGTKFFVAAAGYRIREVRVPPASSHAKLTDIRVELVPLRARALKLRVLTAAGALANSIRVSWMDSEGDSIRDWKMSAELVTVDNLPPEEVQLRIADARNKLLFRLIQVVPTGQTVEITLPAGLRLRVPWHDDMMGSVSLLVKRTSDDLYVPMRRDRKRGELVSASLVPPGPYEAQLVRYEREASSMGSSGNRTTRTTVLRHAKFDVDSSGEHVIDWGEAK